MKKNKLLTGALVTALALGITSPVLAEETVVKTESSTTTVSYSADSTYTVTIPKTITLNPTTKTGTYEVETAGDIAGTYVVTVTPDATFTMKQAGKADVTATVTQSVTEWTVSTLGQSTTGTIEALDLSAGSWSGTLNFTIQLISK